MIKLLQRKTVSIGSHAWFTAATFIAYLMLLGLLRVLLIFYNQDLLDESAKSAIGEAFINGLRFDAKMTVFAFIPLLFAFVSPLLMSFRRLFVVWLSVIASLAILLGIIELNFYQEFHQRLNSLFFQYLKEDPATVMSMLWHGFPVVKLLLSWGC